MSTGVPERAFLRAAADLGELPHDRQLWPAGSVEAAAVLSRLRAAEADDPAGYGPLAALAGSWQAQLLLTEGEIGEAARVADQAVASLVRFADRGEPIQAAMVVALTVAAYAAAMRGDQLSAQRAAHRAADILQLLVDRDPGYADDLAAGGPAPAGAPAAESGALAEAVQVLEQGVQLSREGRYGPADRVLRQAEDMLTALSGASAAGSPNLAAQRQLARACWRRSMLAQAEGRRPDALRLGRRGVALGRELLDLLPPGEDRSMVIAEVATAAADLAEVTFAADRPDEGFALLDDALARCHGNPHRAVRRALGTVLHNRATHLLNALVAALRNGTPARSTPAEISQVAAEAVQLRRDLVDPTDLLTSWELANSLLLRAKVATVTMDVDTAVDAVGDATHIVRGLGPGAADLRSQVATLARLIEQAAPHHAAQQRAAGRWPT